MINRLVGVLKKTNDKGAHPAHKRFGSESHLVLVFLSLRIIQMLGEKDIFLTNDIVYHGNLAVNTPSDTGSFLLTLVKIDYSLNQLCTRLMKLELDISTIYKYIDGPSNKFVTPMLVKPMNLKLYGTIYEKITKLSKPT